MKFVKRTLPYLCLLPVVLGVSFFSCRTDTVARVVAYRAENGGYGYRIESRSRVYIDQPFIPGIEGSYPFRTAEEAMRTGTLVLEKLKENRNPSVSSQELDSLNICYPRSPGKPLRQ